jgi:hypothetical protein
LLKSSPSNYRKEFSAMRQHFLLPGLMLVLAFALSTAAADDKKDPDDATKPDNDAAKIAAARELMGKLTKLSSTGNSIVLRVEYLDMKPNASYREGAAGSKELQHLIKQQNQLARLQAQIMKTRNPAKRAAKLQQFAVKVQRQGLKANAQHLPYRVVTRHQDVPLVAAEDVKVRVAAPPIEFDEKGNPRKYTPEELRKLRGPEKLWGYPGDWSNLQNGQEVKVFLARNKKAVARAESDDKGNETKKAEVSRIYILASNKKK